MFDEKSPSHMARSEGEIMISNVDPGKMMFLSVALNDGSMEVFEDIKDAVAHASELVEHGGSERGIFVALPRARVHMGVRVDPVEPPPMPMPVPTPLPNNTPELSKEGEGWVRAQGLDEPIAA
jgi:hypothetical protein